MQRERQPTVFDTPAFRPAMAVRQKFLPPCYHVRPLAGRALTNVPPVPLLSDVFGEKPAPRRVALRLAWQAEALHLRADFEDIAPRLDASLPPDAPTFWQQDHVEFRLFRDDESSVQLLIVEAGRYWDSLGLWRDAPSNITVRDAEPLPGYGRALEVHIDARAAVGHRLQAGKRLTGLLAQVGWMDKSPQVSVSTPAVLGFSQRQRAGQFLLVEDSEVAWQSFVPTEPWQAGPNAAMLELSSNIAGLAVLHVTGDSHDTVPRELARLPMELRPGCVQVPVEVELSRPHYTRMSVAIEVDGQRIPLGSVTLRGGPDIEPVRTAAGRDGRCFFTPGELDRVRAALRKPPLDWLRSTMEANRSKLHEATPSSAASPYLLVAGSGQWHRVASESLVPGGRGRHGDACGYIWSRLDPEAQGALRQTARRPEPTPEALEQILDGLNRLLAQPDFYDAEAFAGVPVSDEVAAILQADAPAAEDLLRANRALLEAAVECIVSPFTAQIAQLSHLLDAWLLEADAALPARAHALIQAMQQTLTLGEAFDLHEGNASFVLAWTYEAMGEELDASQRAAWREVMERFLDLYLRTARARRWQTTSTANANPVCNGGGGVLGLVLLHHCPDKAIEAVALARKLIWNWVDWCNGPDGGNTEGSQYWQYGTEAFHRFVLAMRNRLGDDDGLMDQPTIRRHMNMVRVGLCPDGALHGVNDTVPMPVGGSIGWMLARCCEDAAGLWYGDQALRTFAMMQRAGRPLAYAPSGAWAALVRPDVPEAKDPPPMPQQFVLDDIQYGILRSEPRWDAPLVAGLKGSRPPYTHHNQADTGSFFVHVRGRRLLIDPGYYKPAATDHSLPMINRVAPEAPDEFVGQFIVDETIDINGQTPPQLTVDVTPAYRGVASCVRRTLAMLGETLVLIDDIRPAGLAVRALLQFGGQTSLSEDGRCVKAEHGGVSCQFQLNLPLQAEITLLAERPLDDVHWGYRFADCRWFPAEINYVTDDAPLVAVVSDRARTSWPAMKISCARGDMGIEIQARRSMKNSPRRQPSRNP